MAATFEWQQDTGAATGSPAKGTTRTGAVANSNWKKSGVIGDAYSSFPIPAGENSFEIFQFARFSGTFNNILNLLWAHTAGAFGTGVQLYGAPACTNDASRLLYTTPSQVANAGLTNNMTSAISIGSGVAVAVGATGPEATGKAPSGNANPLFTNYLATQLQTSGSAEAGDTASITTTLRYDEN